MAVVWTIRAENLLDSQGRPVAGDVWMLFHNDGRVTWQEATEETVSKGGSSGSSTPDRSAKRRGRIPAEVKLAKDAYEAAKPRRTTADVEGTFAGERNEDGSPGLPVFKPAGRPPIIPPKPRPKPKPEDKPRPNEPLPGPADNPDDLFPPPDGGPRPEPKRGR